MSNYALCQSKIATFLAFYFSIIGIGSSIISSEIYNYYNEDDINKDYIMMNYIICNCSTLFLSNLLYCINIYFSYCYLF